MSLPRPSQRSASHSPATAVPASLHIDPWKSEPDTRAGARPEALQGTLTARGLTAGRAYIIYRWDSVDKAFTYDDDTYKVGAFTASGDTHVFVDPTSFESDGTTYYRVLAA